MKKINDQVESYWNNMGTDFYLSMVRFFNEGASKIMSDLEKKQFSKLFSVKNKFVLDIGAGLGRWTRDFAMECKHLTSLELAKKLSDYNKQTNKDLKNVKFVNQNILNFTSKKKFDVIFCNWIIMYLSDDELDDFIQILNKLSHKNTLIILRESVSANIEYTCNEKGYFVIYRKYTFLINKLKKYFLIKDIKGIVGLPTFNILYTPRLQKFYKNKFCSQFAEFILKHFYIILDPIFLFLIRILNKDFKFKDRNYVFIMKPKSLK